MLDYLNGFGAGRAILQYVLGDGEDYGLGSAAREQLQAEYTKLARRFLAAAPAGDLSAVSLFTRQMVQFCAGRKRQSFCGSGAGMLGVSASGELYPCNDLAEREEYRLGHVATGLDQEKLARWRSYLNVDNKPTCQVCWARYICGGGCLSSAIKHGGSAVCPIEAECELLRHLIQLAIWVHLELREKHPQVFLSLFPILDFEQFNLESPIHSPVRRQRMLRSSLPALLSWIIVTALVLFSSAGRCDLPMVWAYLCVYYGSQLTTLLIVFRRDPDLYRERSRPGPGTQEWDRVWLRTYGFLCFATWVIAGLDVGRFHWSDTVPFGLQIAGLAGFVASTGLVKWAMSANTFYSGWVRIQKERGHRVITSGPYQYVRHPGYTGNILLWLSSALVLGSWLAMLPATMIAFAYIIRTVLEDRTLRDELEGYEEYARKVRCHLVPGLW